MIQKLSIQIDHNPLPHCESAVTQLSLAEAYIKTLALALTQSARCLWMFKTKSTWFKVKKIPL